MTPCPTLRTIIINATGQDLRTCRGCMVCDLPRNDGMDVSLGALVQLVLMNDDEVLTTRTLWSDTALQSARTACMRNLNLETALLALRDEAKKRGVDHA
jgi:heterodisulfide reductase subunit C